MTTKRFEAEREIATTPEELFGFLADGERLGEWAGEPEGAPRRSRIDVTHVGGPRSGAGARYRLHHQLGRHEMSDYEFETAEYEPPNRLAFRSPSAYDIVFELEPTTTGTLLRCTREYELRGVRGRLAGLALRPSLARESIEADLARIDRAVKP